jgi:long-chain acyl-CoA synthetase
MRTWEAGHVADQKWKTIPQLFAENLKADGKRIAFCEKVGGTWQKTSVAELARRFRAVSRYLLSLGLEAGERVSLINHNNVAWSVVDFGILHAALANVPIYPSSSPDQILYILENSEARVVFVEDGKQLEKVREIRAQAPSLLEVVLIYSEGVELQEGERALAAVEEEYSHQSEYDATIEARTEALNSEDLASIVYTSGTTGSPKGVMLLHRNFTSNVEAAHDIIKVTPEDVMLSFLPLSHVFERTVGYYFAFFGSVTIYFAESQAKLKDNLKEVQPTFMTSVPRLYEKIRDGIIAKAKAAGGFNANIFDWAVDVGKLRAAEVQGGPPVGFVNGMLIKVADSLVFEKIREAFGGRLRFFVSGGAPLSPDLGNFFLGAGIRILEGYGLTETSPMITANTETLLRIGTVGKPLCNVEVKIAEDGEILARGPNLMKGYFRNEEATKEAIDEEGWFHTGDIGEFTRDGCLRITDRKKNLLVLSNGKNVAPAPIEGKLLNSPFISQSVVLGDNRKFVSVLLVPDYAALAAHAKESLRVEACSQEELCANEKVLAFMLAQVEKETEDFNPYEIPKKVHLLPSELTEEAGELTPTMKVKRKVVMEHYRQAIDALYG